MTECSMRTSMCINATGFRFALAMRAARHAWPAALRAGANALFLGLVALPVTCHADTVASLLGNFTVNQYSEVRIAEDVVNVHYTVIFGQLPALAELRDADTDRDGVTSQAERDAYAGRAASVLAERLTLKVDGQTVPLHATRWTTSLPTEQGGFSLRLDAEFSGALPAASARSERALEFSNQNYPGRFGWQEIVVVAAPSIKVYATNAFSNSLTAGLSEAAREMPAAGPLDERVVHLSFTSGASPEGAQPLQPRPGTVVAASTAPTSTPEVTDASWLQTQTRRLVSLISQPQVETHVALFALLAAVLLGALHAFSPGHGKAVVGAYLIGSRATPRHAVFLGLTVTITHTLGVFALGFATLFASHFFLPERVFPVLALVSGLLVLGMGIVLVVQRWDAARIALKRGTTTATRASRTAQAYRAVAHAHVLGAINGNFILAHAADHSHTHGDHHHDHHHDHGGARAHHAPGTHSHGGTMHSHLPPGTAGEEVSWRSLLALGISGGLVPCPSAMVLLLAAVALNKTAYGLLLVVAFSVGLALTLTAVGLAFLYARSRIRRSIVAPRWTQLVPIMSAAAITLLGALLCYGALTGGQIY
jgi:nickel/cobalt transporter (NicO) family protein